MRFCYFVLATAATLLACTNAVTAENQHSQTTSKLTTRTLDDAPTNGAVTRSLRVDKTYEEESLDSLDEMEERGAGYTAQKLVEMAKGKDKNLPKIIAKLSRSEQKQIIRAWWSHSDNLETVAKRLGMSSITDTAHKNYPILQRFEKFVNKRTNA
ncbi:hypothetical protein PF008_g25665 [Phytophthora fragariae]|uniref:RxLR effector protein n=1 Tax=Phytophthora fragariae TaxID=53985 RepID=A0A6G0QJX2_9STRA|nr:hypothetical protein PF008_g25665 [Phytophthora fragariae]